MAALKQIVEDVGWIFVMLATLATVFVLDAGGRLTYLTSLAFWLVPILYLWPLFWSITAAGRGRRRRALSVSVATLFTFGALLDFLVGHLTFRFEDCSRYVYCLRGPGGLVPLEELLFYGFAPVAIVLVYACADELWLVRYNPRDELLRVKLVDVSRGWLMVAAVVAAVIALIWAATGRFPTYLAFLAGLGLAPTIVLYRTVRNFMNWPAFAVTVLFVLVTSIVWEVTLALPRGWWGFEPAAMVGVFVQAWSTSRSPFPVEEMGVWLASPFFSLLTYEFAKAFFHHPRPTREALFGAVDGHARPAAIDAPR